MNNSYIERAQRKWGKRAAWITGSGPFAVLAHCRKLTVTLWPMKQPAEAAKSQIDKTGCGGECTGNHEIIDLSPRPKSQKPYSEKKRARHRENVRRWNKANRDSINETLRKYKIRNGEVPGTTRNRESQKHATQSGKPWGPVEDAFLFSGKTQLELVHALGRSITAIQRRKWRLRQEDAST